MKSIFTEGEFSAYSNIRLDKSMRPIYESTQFRYGPTTVFISHKHDDLDNLRGVIGMLEAEFNVQVYIDSRDPSMPKITSAVTGENIKDRIRWCNKFILLATNGAIESKWCNWELGYGDAQKYKEHIALFPMGPKNGAYKGNEYMALYPHIAFYDGTEKDTTGKRIPRGYYVYEEITGGRSVIIPLKDWFAKR